MLHVDIQAGAGLHVYRLLLCHGSLHCANAIRLSGAEPLMCSTLHVQRRDCCLSLTVRLTVHFDVDQAPSAQISHCSMQEAAATCGGGYIWGSWLPAAERCPRNRQHAVRGGEQVAARAQTQLQCHNTPCMAHFTATAQPGAGTAPFCSHSHSATPVVTLFERTRWYSARQCGV